MVVRSEPNMAPSDIMQIIQEYLSTRVFQKIASGHQKGIFLGRIPALDSELLCRDNRECQLRSDPRKMLFTNQLIVMNRKEENCTQLELV